MKSFVLCLLSLVLVFAASAQAPQSRRMFGNRLARQNAATSQPQAQPLPPTPATVPASSGEAPALNWDGAPVDLLLQAYGERTGKTILKDPQVPQASITLKSRAGQKLSDEEYLLAIETVLEMNGVHLEPYGESFIRALKRDGVKQSGIPLILDPEQEVDDIAKIISSIVKPQYMPLEEAQEIIKEFVSKEGKVQGFARTGTILVTDSAMNVRRIRQIIKEIDIKDPPMSLKRYDRTLKYQTAENVAAALQKCVEFSKLEEQERKGEESSKSKKKVQPEASRTPPVGMRNLLNRNQPQQSVRTQPDEATLVSAMMSGRELIRGTPLFLYDTENVPNKLIIVSYPENMELFDWVIEQLDVETVPEEEVRVFRLKYAEAEDVADNLDKIVSESSSTKGDDKRAKPDPNAKPAQPAAKPKVTNATSGGVKAGELNKETVKVVIADKRINAVVVKAKTAVMDAVEAVIESMDVKLDQVLIETVIIEVQLGEEMQTGIDWVKGLNRKGNNYQQALGGGGGSASAIAGAVTNGASALIDGVSTVLPSIFSPGSGLTYALFSEKFDIGAVISASESDNRSKYLASPIVMTLDNKEAVVNCTKMKYLLKGFTSSGNSYSTIAVPDYEQKELGIELKITPKINPSGTVMLTVEEKYTQVGANQTIQYSAGNDGGLKDVDVPTTITREMRADVLLESSQTVVFGGLTETKADTSGGGIPLLVDIPVIGRYLFGRTSDKEDRTELLVFMTPYVLKEGDEAEAEAMRRKNVLSDARPWQDRGWSKSKLADPVSAKEQLRRQKEEWKKLDEEHKIGLDIEKSKKDRVRELKQRARKESEQRRKEAEYEAEEAKEEAEEDAKEQSRAIEAEVKAFNAKEDVRASQRARDELEARMSNSLLRKLHQENGIGVAK